MNTIYLQCDCRYNKWLLEKLGEGKKYVINYTVERCCGITSSQIVAGIYNCPENKQLLDVLNAYGISCVLSDEEDVNKRFLNTVTKLKTDYIIRIGGDQVLIDTERVNMILSEMEKQNAVWFYEEICSSLLPDIVKRKYLEEHQNELKEKERYFESLLEVEGIKRYKLPYPLLLPFDFRINSESGFRVCKNVIENELDTYAISEKMIKRMVSKNNHIIKKGYLASWIIPPKYSDFYYGEDGMVNPWIGSAAIDLIKDRINEKFNVFEWGTGNSTLFWSQHVKSVVSVEYNNSWYMKLKKLVPENVDLRYITLENGGAYCKEILNTNIQFDIILIDGRDRVNCAYNALDKLTQNGIIIWDNTERDYYQPGMEFLKQNGFKQLELSGMLYGYVGYECYTSIFYREDNVFDL